MVSTCISSTNISFCDWPWKKNGWDLEVCFFFGVVGGLVGWKGWCARELLDFGLVEA